MRRRREALVYRPDLSSPQEILDPHPHYAKLRELGPVVWLPRHMVYALPRSAEFKAVPLDDETFVSGDGVALNPGANRPSRGTTLNSDGEDHAAFERRTVDGVEVAAALPMSVVPDLVGWPAEGRENLLRWGAATMVAQV